MMTAPPVLAGGGNADSRVFPVNSKPHGLSYGEWSARQWQWEFSLPLDANPLADTADCSAGQSGSVWFLGGTFTLSNVGGVVVGKAVRTCTIPSGTALFFPLLDTECSTIEGNGTTEDELRDCAKMFTDLVDTSSLFLEIDGQPVTNLGDFRVQSPLFTFGPLPPNNILGAPAGSTSPSVSDGYFVMLKPLSVGRHTLHFGGMADFTPVGGPVFVQDITYHLTVVPRGRQ
jgi:hypothetical protein